MSFYAFTLAYHHRLDGDSVLTGLGVSVPSALVYIMLIGYVSIALENEVGSLKSIFLMLIYRIFLFY